MAAAIVQERKKMDILSCLVIGGKYDATTGDCLYHVKINENGEKEFVKENGGR